MSESYTCMKCYKQVERMETHICRPIEPDKPAPLGEKIANLESDTQERIAVSLESIASSLNGLLEYLVTRRE